MANGTEGMRQEPRVQVTQLPCPIHRTTPGVAFICTHPTHRENTAHLTNNIDTLTHGAPLPEVHAPEPLAAGPP